VFSITALHVLSPIPVKSLSPLHTLLSSILKKALQFNKDTMVNSLFLVVDLGSGLGAVSYFTYFIICDLNIFSSI